MLYIGIDLGTSSVKLLLSDGEGKVIKTVSREYPLYFPHPAWSEQQPEDWRDGVLSGIAELVNGCDKKQIAGIGVAGQMHGLVILDKNDRVIRPAILWNDGRTDGETEYLNNIIGRERLSDLTGNIAFAGFTAPKLLWLRENEPQSFERISKIMLPKDYINYILTGSHSTDFSDASGMLLLDVKNKCWSREMISICGIDEKMLPKLYESYEPIGKIKPELAEKLGLPEDVTVTAGAGDNAAAAVGMGVVGEGGCNISVGTSGTLFVSSADFRLDENNALHAFAHADGGFHLMGCMLSAASCNKWIMENIFKSEDYEGEQSAIDERRLGENQLFFLPYLMGERSPINDTNARGTFIGMTMDTSRADMLLAVLEGVAFAMRDSLEVAKKLGIRIDSATVCGGGAKSRLWMKIFSNVLNIPLYTAESEQGPGMGAVILAAVARGEYGSVNEACHRTVRLTEAHIPDEALSSKYQRKYDKFKKIYPACKELFAELGQKQEKI